MKAWRTVPLGKVATIERKGVDASDIAPGTLYVGLENIQSGGGFINVRAVDRGELVSSKFAFTPQHLLYGKLRPYLAKIARPYFAGICSTDILPVLPGSKVDREYLAYFLLQRTMVALANSRATGANLPRLSPKALAEFEVPLPPLPEQRRIAEVLDRAETLRAQRRAALAQLEMLADAVFFDLFGDPGTNSMNWPVQDVGNICSRVTVGIVVQPASYYRPSGVPALRSLNVRRDEIVSDDLVFFSPDDNERLSKTRVWENDIVIVRSGKPGTAAIIPRELSGINAIDLLIVTPNPSRVHPAYLCWYFNSRGGQQIVLGEQRGQVQKHLNVTSLKAALVAVPPLPLQREFARRLAAVQRLKATQRASLAELDALFASLQHRAFRGEL
ncbi:MAG TPA: restriction endonuclease subunit S [Longimicrobium sp.]|nr:restriction endonuclease subunit S [Longimicrobium sp.]